MKKILYVALLAMFLVGCDEGYNNNPSDENSNQSSSNDSGNKPDDAPFIPVFSVSEDKQVIFSPGNLQYTQSTNTWSFALNQYDVLGTDNVIGGGRKSLTEFGYWISGDDLADKVDLFGRSSVANNFGITTSGSHDDYKGSFVDWGTNKIGDDDPNTWRTLTGLEWNYVVFQRSNADNLKGVAQINGINGLILLPDDWTCPAGVTFKPGFRSIGGVNSYELHQTFSADQWSKLEQAGAVFLPAAGYRYWTAISSVQGYGYYWSSTTKTFIPNEGNKRNPSYTLVRLTISSDEVVVEVNENSIFGHSVRLVKDL